MRYWTFWNDSVRIDVGVTLEVVSLDTVEISGVLESGVVPVEVLHPLVDLGVAVSNGSVVALEVGKVDGIESDDGGEQPDVGFGQLVGVQVGSAVFQHLFDAIEALEKGFDVGFVCVLEGGKAAFVNAVVDIGVDPFVEGVNFLGVVLGVVSNATGLFGDEIIESVVEITDHFAGFVVDDGVELVIPNDGYGASLLVVWIGSLVELSNTLLVLVTGDLVSGSGNTVALGLFVGNEAPAFTAEERIDDVDG